MQKVEFDVSYMVFLLVLCLLNWVSFYLFYLMEICQVYFWMVYGVLCQFIGELSFFLECFNMLGEVSDGIFGLFFYDYIEFNKCFLCVYVLISNLFNEIMVGFEFLVILEYCDGYYVVELFYIFFDCCNCFYLVVRIEQDFKWVVDVLFNDVCLVSLEDILGLVLYVLFGLELIYMQVVLQGLLCCVYLYYFCIEQISQLWDLVECYGVIVLQWLDVFDDLKVEIVVF